MDMQNNHTGNGKKKPVESIIPEWHPGAGRVKKTAAGQSGQKTARPSGASQPQPRRKKTDNQAVQKQPVKKTAASGNRKKTDASFMDSLKSFFENMRPKPEKGRNSANSHGASDRPRRRQPKTPQNPVLQFMRMWGTTLYLPLLFVYLELAFHLYMKMSMKYFLILFFFSVAAGLFFSLFTNHFSKKVNYIITVVITALFGLVYCIEIICKYVLQQYYQLLSTAGTAANNKLTDYIGAIFKGIVHNFFGLILMLLPIAFILIFGKKLFAFRKKPLIFGGFTVAATIVVHIIALLIIQLPWKGDFTPKLLYASDTNVDDQVEQLGIVTMLRLDIKHTIFGAGHNLSLDSDGLDQLNVMAGADSKENSDGGESTDETGETIDTSPNVMNIDFSAVPATSNGVSWLNEYFQNVVPTNKNKYTGMFKDYNVIFLTAEGFSGYMIDKDLTPTLYKLNHEGFVFNNFYSALHYTSTSGGEFQNLTGLYPKAGNPISMTETGEKGTNLYFTLAHQLNRLGYQSTGYHFNGNMYGRSLSHPNLGYTWKQGNSLTLETNEYGGNVWPQSDEYMVSQTIDEYIHNQPFNIYYMTISGHMPYSNSDSMMSARNKEAVANLPYSDTTKAYIAANLELEKGLTLLIQRLEEAGIADKTLIVMAPDHIPYFDLPVLEELSGKTFGKSEDVQYLDESSINFDVYKNSLIIWSASMTEPVEVNKVCCQVDILPTVSNLLGLTYDSRLFAGSDILSDASGLVVFSSNCWLTDKGLYNRYTGQFTPAEGVNMTETEINDYVEAVKKVVSYKIQMTPLIIENNYYNLLGLGS